MGPFTMRSHHTSARQLHQEKHKGRNRAELKVGVIYLPRISLRESPWATAAGSGTASILWFQNKQGLEGASEITGYVFTEEKGKWSRCGRGRGPPGRHCTFPLSAPLSIACRGEELPAHRGGNWGHNGQAKKKHIMGKLPSASVLDRASGVIGTWLCLHPHPLTCPAHFHRPKVTRSQVPKTPAGSASPEATVTARP